MIHRGVPSPSAHEGRGRRQQEVPMSSTLFSRRKFFEAGTAAAAAAGVAAISGAALAPQPQERGSGLEPLLPPSGAQRFFLSPEKPYLIPGTQIEPYHRSFTTQLS